jgi:hypothetical protein
MEDTEVGLFTLARTVDIEKVQKAARTMVDQTPSSPQARSSPRLLLRPV